MTPAADRTFTDAELVIGMKKGLFERSRFLTPDATLAALQDLKVWIDEEVAFEEAASASFGRALSDLWHAEYLDQLPPLLNKFERLASAYFVRRGSVAAFHGFCNAWREGVLRRVLLFAEEELELHDRCHAPARYAFLAAGSLGRLEQTIEEADPYFLVWSEGDGDYFEKIAYRVLAILDQLGMVGKGGPATVARLLWRGSLEQWHSFVHAEEELEDLAARMRLLADLRCVCGDERVGSEAMRGARSCLDMMRHHERLALIAKHTVAEQVALGVFGGIRVERSGEHAGQLHLGEAALSPLIDVVRLLAVQHDMEPASTLGRLAVLGVRGILEKDLVERLEAAFHFIAAFKIGKEIALQQPYLNPADLTVLDQRKLKAALEAVRQLQRVVRRTQLAGLPHPAPERRDEARGGVKHLGGGYG